MYLKYVQNEGLTEKAGPPLVWVPWVLQHPCFLMFWVLAPNLFGIFFSFKKKKNKDIKIQLGEVRPGPNFICLPYPLEYN